MKKRMWRVLCLAAFSVACAPAEGGTHETWVKSIMCRTAGLRVDPRATLWLNGQKVASPVDGKRERLTVVLKMGRNHVKAELPDGTAKDVKAAFAFEDGSEGKTHVPDGLVFYEKPSLVPPEPARPYEIEWAGRTKDDYPPLCELVDATGWTTRTKNAVARLETTRERVLFGDSSVRLWYRKTGERPFVDVCAPEPVRIGKPFSAMSLWVYGNFDRYAVRRNVDAQSHRPVLVSALFDDADGNRVSFKRVLALVYLNYWFQFRWNLTPDEMARLEKGATFRGFRVENMNNLEYDIALDFTSFCVFDDEKGTVAIAPRPKRPVKLFADQPQGMNTGAGTLPFPNTPNTVIPPVAEPCADLEFRFPAKPEESWDDLAFRYRGGDWIPVALGGGVFPREAAKGGTFRFRRAGNSIVCDLACAPTGGVTHVRFGSLGTLPKARKLIVPYLFACVTGEKDTTINWKNRPGVVVAELHGKPFFVAETFDWTQSNASVPFGTEQDPCGGTLYKPKTDGTLNRCVERFVWSLSPRFEEVLPNIPNPPSPWRAKSGSHVFAFSSASEFVDREGVRARWRAVRRRGQKRMMICDHEQMWRDHMESFTFRTETAPGKGGDAAERAHARYLQDELGYLYGSYNNYSDLPPVNAWWHPDRVARSSVAGRGGQHEPSFVRCYLPKPAWAASVCAEICAEIQRKFGFNCCYSDVSTAYAPWMREDYDARVPGAATFASSFYSYGEILHVQQDIWKGPVFSEGWNHPYYAGLSTGDFARDDDYFAGPNGADRTWSAPWLLDFDLLRMHPKASDLGMGLPITFFGPDGRQRPADRDVALDRFIAAELAYGHGPVYDQNGLQSELRSYFLPLGITTKYSAAEVTEIRYADAAGDLLDTAAAIGSGALSRSQARIVYSDGTVLAVNGSLTEPFVLEWEGRKTELMPNGFVGHSGDGTVKLFSSFKDGHRADLSVCLDYVYVDGRGTFTRFDEGGADHVLLRLPEPDGTEEVLLLLGTSEAELPYKAARITALAEDGSEMTTSVPFAIRDGRTVVRPVKGVYSFRCRKAL